jgi:predicted Zn-dependent protease with MMP-like domain
MDESPSIVLYRKNLARAVKSRVELSEQIRDTLLHEIGHLEGLDEDDLRRRGME